MTILRTETRLCRRWSDVELTEKLTEAAQHERASLIALLIRLGEFDRRKLDRKKGYPHAYDYCMRALRYSRSGAARRIAAARAGRRFPSLLAMLESGELPLVGAALLAPHLTSENHRRFLRAARGRSQDEIAKLVAALAPEQVRRDLIRINPTRGDVVAAEENGSARAGCGTGAVGKAGTLLGSKPEQGADAEGALDLFAPDALKGEGPAPSESPVISGKAEELTYAATEPTYTATITLSSRTHELLMRARQVMSHRTRDGGFDAILGIALDLLLDSFDRDRKTSSKPRTLGSGAQKSRAESQASALKAAARSRYIPEAVKQAAWERDGGCCAFVGSDGMTCRSRENLEFDHAVPYALGGSSDTIENIRLLCREHNLIAAERIFGPRNHPG